jgi:TPR repeat protein
MLIILAWGDADALAEAGFCYAQGVGCKKDLKKSAKFYRQAEAKGISMIGNSWYVSITSNCYVSLTLD